MKFAAKEIPWDNRILFGFWEDFRNQGTRRKRGWHPFHMAGETGKSSTEWGSEHIQDCIRRMVG